MKYITLIFVACTLLQCTNNKNTKADFMVGVAAYSINPEMGAFIAGDKFNRQFKGIHDSIYVKALVVSDTKNNMALITFDCIGMLYPTLQEIRKAVALKIPASELDPSHIVMASTHTHEGPDVVGVYGPDQMTSGLDSNYMKKIVRTSTDAIVEAWKNKKEAAIRYADTTCGEGWVYNICEPDDIDRSVAILQFVSKDGKSLATLTNFACHPTFLDGVTDQVSADYIAGLYNHLDKTFGGTNFFLQGPSGGWIQPEYEPKTFEQADKRGRELGVIVEKALKNYTQMEQTDIVFKSKIFNMPVSNEGYKILSKAGVISRSVTDSVQTEVAWFSLGNAQFVTHPAETSPIHSLQSKAMMKNSGPRFVIEIGMDGLGYIVKPNYFDSTSNMPNHEYLTQTSVHRDAASILLGVVHVLANEK